MISVKDVSIELKGLEILKAISVDVSDGEHIALVGPNGAGKTTLLRAMAGLLTPSSGRIDYSGRPMPQLSPSERAKAISYLPQKRELAWDLYVEDVVALGRFAWGARRYQDLQGDALAVVDLALEKSGAARFKGRRVHELSGGEQARAHLGRTLAAGSSLLLLDEPCASLDIRQQLDLMDVLETERQRGATIITVLHDLAQAERFATRLIVLQSGVIVADGSAVDVLDVKILAEVFGLSRGASGEFSRVSQPVS